MKEEYPDHQTYQELYWRYHQGRDVAELIDLMEPVKGMSFLDLCAGDGRLTLAALEKEVKKATLIEAERQMIPAALCDNRLVRIHVDQVQATLAAMQTRGEFFDRIVCRQGVNYWLDYESAKLVATVLVPGGIFAFNTFNQKPSETPRVLQYELDGHTFVEISWLVNETVHHLQVREGLLPHYTSFMWIPPDLLRSILEPHFVVVEQRRDKTSLYRCEKT